MSIAELTPRAVQPDLDRFEIIDVREAYEFHGPLGHIRGATSIPLGELSDRMREIPTDRPLLLVCRPGKRSLRGCQELVDHGVGAPTNLAGGMIAWNREELPAEYTEPGSLVELRDQIVRWLAQVGSSTQGEVFDVVRSRFEQQGLSYDAPTHAALEGLLEFAEQFLANAKPPDQDQSLAFFRRVLAVL